MNDLPQGLIALIGLVVTIISSATTHQITKNHADATITSLSAEIGQLNREAEQYRLRSTAAEADLADMRSTFDSLQILFLDLSAKYERLVNPSGRVIKDTPFARGESRAAVRTGDGIEFGLASSSVTLRVLRVTRGGLVLIAEGCRYPHLVDGVRSPPDGDTAFALSLDLGLTVAVSSVCCARGVASCPLDDLEQVTVTLIAFDVDEQTAQIAFDRRLAAIR